MIIPMQYSVVFGEFSDGEKRGLRLTFQQPRLADSGIYVCQASNRFETKKSTIKLAVYPPGNRQQAKKAVLYNYNHLFNSRKPLYRAKLPGNR